MNFKGTLNKELEDLSKTELQLTKLRQDLENFDEFSHLPNLSNLFTLLSEFESHWNSIYKMTCQIKEGKIKLDDDITVL